METSVMPRFSKCNLSDKCPEPIDHHQRCPKFDAEFWSKIQLRKDSHEQARSHV